MQPVVQDLDMPIRGQQLLHNFYGNQLDQEPAMATKYTQQSAH